MKVKKRQPVIFKSKEELIIEFGQRLSDSFENQIGFYDGESGSRGYHKILVNNIKQWTSSYVICSANSFTPIENLERNELPTISFLAGEKVKE